MRNNKSIIQVNSDSCYVCGCKGKMHEHHIFYGTANRKKSDEDGMVIYLCPSHHNMSENGIHFNKALDEKVKINAEKIWIKTYCDKDETKQNKIKQFISRYGKNYLDEGDL